MTIIHIDPSYNRNIVFNGNTEKVSNKQWNNTKNIFLFKGQIETIGELKEKSIGYFYDLENGESISEKEYEETLALKIVKLCDDKGYTPMQLKDESSIAGMEAKLIQAKFKEDLKIKDKVERKDQYVEDHTKNYTRINIADVECCKYITGIFEEGINYNNFDICDGYYVVDRMNLMQDTFKELCEKYDLKFENAHTDTIRFTKINNVYVMDDKFINQLQAIEYNHALKIVESTKALAYKIIHKMIADKMNRLERENVLKVINETINSVSRLTCKTKSDTSDKSAIVNKLKQLSIDISFVSALESIENKEVLHNG